MNSNRLVRLLCAATAIAGLSTASACSAKTPATTSAATPTPQVSVSTAPPTPQVISISAPAKIGSHAKLTDAEHAKLAADTEASIKTATASATSVAVGFYGTPDAKKDKIYLSGITFEGTIAPTELQQSIDKSVKEIQDDPMVVTETPDQGDLGGEARCGDVKVAGMTSGLCAWRVKNFIVFVLWYNHSAKALAAELPTIRAAVETRK